METPIKDIDYYLNLDGNFVFTEIYHLKRGYCCKNGCKHCPWKYKKTDITETSKLDTPDEN